MYLNTITSAAEVIRGIMSTGIIVQVEPNIFLTILAKIQNPLVLISHKKAYRTEAYQYLTNYKGLFFWVETKQPLQLPDAIELLEVEKMMIPRF